MRVTFLLVAICLFTSVWAQDKEVPPGTVHFDDNLYIDRLEVTTSAWSEYQFWVAKRFGKESSEYQSTIYDAQVWYATSSANIQTAEYYMTHGAYARRPMMGISHDQAKSYCSWRSMRVNEMYGVKSKAIEDWSPDSTYVDLNEKVTYRLPTKDEWEEIADLGYSTKIQKLFDKKGVPKGYFKDSNYDGSEALLTNDGGKFPPNEIGVFDLFGNVAEMVEEPNIAKGGSWIHKRETLSVSDDIPYTKPEPWLGFRCICEMH